jgi:hypothetical protein
MIGSRKMPSREPHAMRPVKMRTAVESHEKWLWLNLLFKGSASNLVLTGVVPLFA